MASGGCGCEPGWPSAPRRRGRLRPRRAAGSQRRRCRPATSHATPTRRCGPTTAPGPRPTTTGISVAAPTPTGRSTTWRGRWSSTPPRSGSTRCRSAGEIVELAAGTGWWSPLLAGKGELWCYDAVPETLDLARRRLVAHGLRAHLHLRDAWAEPDRPGRCALLRLLAEPRAAGATGRLPGALCAAGSSPAARSRSSTRARSGIRAAAQRLGPDDGDVRRHLGDVTFRIPKVYYAPDELTQALTAAGFVQASVTATSRFFLLGTAEVAGDPQHLPSGSVPKGDEPAGPRA